MSGVSPASKRLFLASASIAGLSDWLDTHEPRPRRALFLPTAANPWPEATFVDVTRLGLQAAGLTVTTFDLAEETINSTRRAVEATDLVAVGGGYVVYLLEHVRRTRFDEIVRTRVLAGELAYVGISAGAALAGPDLSSFADDEDPGRVDDLRGLSLVPFVVLPHRNRAQAARHDRLIAAAPPGRYLSLTDDQVALVTDEITRVVP